MTKTILTNLLTQHKRNKAASTKLLTKQKKQRNNQTLTKATLTNIPTNTKRSNVRMNAACAFCVRVLRAYSACVLCMRALRAYSACAICSACSALRALLCLACFALRAMRCVLCFA